MSVITILQSFRLYNLHDRVVSLFASPFGKFLLPLVLRGVCSYFCRQVGSVPRVFSSLCIMTVVVPLSTFLMCILALFFSSVITFLSLAGKLCLGLVIGICASCILISSRYLSRATDRWTGGSQLDLT